MDTLILNSDAAPISFLPLSAVSWQESIKYMWLDRVNVLEWYDDWIVKSPTWETKVPAVMMVKDYVKQTRDPKFSKYNVLLRDDFACQYCETEVTRVNATLDHVIPIKHGGKTNWQNIVTACMRCNSHKGAKFIKPIRKPYAPSYYELVAVRKKLPFTIKHPSWQEYIQ